MISTCTKVVMTTDAGDRLAYCVHIWRARVGVGYCGHGGDWRQWLAQTQRVQIRQVSNGAHVKPKTSALKYSIKIVLLIISPFCTTNLIHLFMSFHRASDITVICLIYDNCMHKVQLAIMFIFLMYANCMQVSMTSTRSCSGSGWLWRDMIMSAGSAYFSLWRAPPVYHTKALPHSEAVTDQGNSVSRNGEKLLVFLGKAL